MSENKEKYKKIERLVHAKMEMITEFDNQIKQREEWKKMLDDEINDHYEEMEEISTLFKEEIR